MLCTKTMGWWVGRGLECNGKGREGKEGFCYKCIILNIGAQQYSSRGGSMVILLL
jgi:hypothetical protein